MRVSLFLNLRTISVVLLFASCAGQLFSQYEPDFLENLSPSLTTAFKKGIRISIQSTHETKEVVDIGVARQTSENFVVPDQFAGLGANIGSYQLKKFQKVLQVDWRAPNIQNFVETSEKLTPTSGPHEFLYYFGVKTASPCDFTFFEPKTSKMLNYEFIRENQTFYPSRRLKEQTMLFVKGNPGKQAVIDADNPVKGSVYLVTDCQYPFALTFNVKEFVYLQVKSTLFKNLGKSKASEHNRVLADFGELE